MTPPRTTTLAPLLVLALLTAAGRAPADDGAGAAEPELALHYDFYAVEDARVPDASGHHRTGRIEHGQVVSGRERPALRLAGDGRLTSGGPGVSLTDGAWTVGAMCRPAAGDGTVLSLGDARDGLSLFLKAGVPHFVVRAGGVVHAVAGTETVDVDQWVHLAGVVLPAGRITVLVDTWPAGEAAGRAPASGAAAPLSVGADSGVNGGVAAWQGLLQDVRVYRGALSRETSRDLLADWAVRPGCGCRK